jgi:hypothetical protein
MKSSRIREKLPDLRYFADVTYVFLDRIAKISRDGTLRAVHVQELGPGRHIASSRVPNCFTSTLMLGFNFWCDSHHILSRTDVRPCRRPTKEDVMGQFRKTTLVTRVLLFLAMSIATPAAAATFDGQWNVQIASAKPACGGGVTVSIGINNGQVASSNPLMNASGRVATAGNISVTLTSGMKRAVGSGRLTATSGSGTWRGPMCSGTWTAQRI